MVGFGGCNRMSGGYALDGDKVTFSDVVATRMACTKGMDVEEGFSRALGEVVRWGIDGTTLRLYDAQGEVVAKFEQRLL
jgi:heat shock protein HslJ